MKKHGHDSYRIVIEHDPDPDFSWLEQDMYDPASPEYAPTYRTEADMKADKPMDPEWYRDPANHVALWMRLEGSCECCEQWETLDSLGSIDFLEDCGDWQTGAFPVPLPASLTGYLRDCANEMIRTHVKD